MPVDEADPGFLDYDADDDGGEWVPAMSTRTAWLLALLMGVILAGLVGLSLLVLRLAQWYRDARLNDG